MHGLTTVAVFGHVRLRNGAVINDYASSDASTPSGLSMGSFLLKLQEDQGDFVFRAFRGVSFL